MVGLSLLTLVPGAVGGSETYVRALTDALARHGELDYLVFVPPVAPDAGSGLPTEVVAEYRRAQTLRQRFAAMALAGARPGPIRRRLERAQALHYPLTIALPAVRHPFAVTLHDVLHLDHPGFVPRWERELRRLAYDRSCRHAALVVVPSAFVRERAAERLRIPAERFRVAHHGIDHGRFAPGPDAREDFLLYPARPWPHKNHARLLEAFALVRRERPSLRLVLTGGGHAGAAYPDGVEVRGLVSGEQLVSLYRRAAALVFPSLYEGFGAPPLEAMACGCPVACADAGALPEVVGDAARLFDPRDPKAIAGAVHEVLDAPEAWAARGVERAAAFSWEASARVHDAAYRELL